MSQRMLDHVPPPSYFDLWRPAYFCIPCLSWCADDPTVSLEGIEFESGSYFTKERIAENWRWWSYYPAVDNAYGQALLDSVDVMMNGMGTSGVFVDGALWDYGGAYSYDRFDGHTADIDPGTKVITRLKTAVPLLQQHAIAPWGPLSALGLSLRPPRSPHRARIRHHD